MLLAQELFNDLGGETGQNVGLTYGLSSDNVWHDLLQTPNLWGHDPAIYDYDPTATALLAAIRETVGSARHTVDISNLWELPDGLFAEALRDGIRQAQAAGAQLVVRILAGSPTNVVDPVSGINAFLAAVDPPEAVPVYVGVMRTGVISWNHAKLIIADGKMAITGGHNPWSNTYCHFAPIHDVSIRLSGTAVAVAQSFLNCMWMKLASRSRDGSQFAPFWTRLRYKGALSQNALLHINAPVVPASGTTMALALARMGSGILPDSAAPSANASRFARLGAVRRARNLVRLSQQMLAGGFYMPFDAEFVEELAKHVAADRKLQIIISGDGATNSSGMSYAGQSLASTAQHIGKRVGELRGLSGNALRDYLNDRLYVAPLRLTTSSESYKWRRGTEAIVPGNHAKIYIIDDHSFYVGSDNCYEIWSENNEYGLQEFGFLISGVDETSRLTQDYWDKAWHNAQPFAYRFS